MSATTGPSRTPEKPRRASGPSRKSSWRLAGQIRRWTSSSSSPQPLAAPSSCVLASDESDTAIHPRNFRERPLGPERGDDQPGGRCARVLLLAGDEVAVAHRVRPEASLDDEVGVAQLPRFVLDPERLDPAADEVVGELLLGVGEAGP